MIRTKYAHTNILNHLKMIKKIAYSFHVSTGIEFEDIYQQACVEWIDKVHTWDSSKCKISTYMWNVLVNNLTTYTNKLKKHREPLEEFTVKFDEAVSSNYLFEKLPFEALAIVDLVAFNPSEFLFVDKSQAINKIEDKMVKSGWNLGQIRYGVKEIEKTFK